MTRLTNKSNTKKVSEMSTALTARSAAPIKKSTSFPALPTGTTEKRLHDQSAAGNRMHINTYGSLATPSRGLTLSVSLGVKK